MSISDMVLSGGLVPDETKSMFRYGGNHAVSLTLSEMGCEDATFKTLCNGRRRRVLEVLPRDGGSSTLSDLAETLAAQENGVDVCELNSGQRKRVYVALYQHHLPMMADYGIVEFDQRSGAVELTERGEQIWHWWHHVQHEKEVSTSQRHWPTLYLGIALLGLTVLTMAWFGLVPPAVAPAFTVAIFLAACVHAGSTRRGTTEDRQPAAASQRTPNNTRS